MAWEHICSYNCTISGNRGSILKFIIKLRLIIKYFGKIRVVLMSLPEVDGYKYVLAAIGYFLSGLKQYHYKTKLLFLSQN